jgi:hypothetical protein
MPNSRKRKFLEACFDVEDIYSQNVKKSMLMSESLKPNSEL